MSSCGAFDEIIEVVEVPTGEFSAVLEADGWLGLSEDVHGHVFDDGHVFGAVPPTPSSPAAPSTRLHDRARTAAPEAISTKKAGNTVRTAIEHALILPDSRKIVEQQVIESQTYITGNCSPGVLGAAPRMVSFARLMPRY